MSKIQNFNLAEVIRYIPAVLQEQKSGDWRIVYHAIHPQTKELAQVRIRVNKIKTHYPTKPQARRHIAEMIQQINAKLSGGWSPFFEGENARLYEKLQDVIKYYLTEKQRELRENTMRSYQSFCRQFSTWATKNLTKDVYCSLINHNIAIRFMDDFYNRNVNARSYNNMLKGCRALFCWCVEKGYSNQNAFEKIKIKKEQKKTRTIVPPDVAKLFLACNVSAYSILMLFLMCYNLL